MSSSEISLFIAMDDALNHYLFALDAASKYPNHTQGQPIAMGENSQAGIAIVLLVNSIEGYFNRILYFLIKNDGESPELLNENVSGKFNKLLGGSHSLKSQQVEVEVARDALVHSHIYETQRTDIREIIGIQKLAASKNSNWNGVVDRTTYRTRSLRLNVIPSEVCFEDAKKVLQFWVDLYGALQCPFPGYASLPPVYPSLYRDKHKGDADTVKRIDEAFGTDGSMGGWINFGH